MTQYRVHIGGRRYRSFDTLEAAREFCNRVFAATNIVLSIVALVRP